MDQRLEKYARLLVELGVNLQPGQPLMIRCPVEQPVFARLLSSLAYERGASEVAIFWQDDQLTRLKYDHAPLEVLEEIPQWDYDRYEYYYKKGAATISLTSSDPNLLKGVDPLKIKAAAQARQEKFRPLDHYTMNNECAWCVAALPNTAWARKVYPDFPDLMAEHHLWEAIYSFTGVNEDDPVEYWKNHIDELEERASRLNRCHFRSLHYQSSHGTDLEVRLPEGHRWVAASSQDQQGTPFIPNIPTEEIFSAPDRLGVDGRLAASRPLAYRGQLVKDFQMEFKEGELTHFSAKEGGKALEDLFAAEPSARRLGEIALVPWDSPISQSSTLFYNTLFDENASCHFAFGAAYPETLEGGEAMTEEELEEAGLNQSAAHVDFMVGTEDLSITGKTADGEELPIFIHGNFAF